MIIRWCMGVTRLLVIRQGWQIGRSRSETEGNNGQREDCLARWRIWYVRPTPEDGADAADNAVPQSGYGASE
jgi:hypothetical protein